MTAGFKKLEDVETEWEPIRLASNRASQKPQKARWVSFEGKCRGGFSLADSVVTRRGSCPEVPRNFLKIKKN
jgi:hypothetical protein